MKVALDLTALVAGDTGVARYSAQLHGELLRRPDIEVSAFAVGRGAPAPDGVRHLRVPLRVIQAGWRRAGLPRAEWFASDIDVVHSIDMVPPATRRPLVMTVHDALAPRLPSLYSARARAIAESNLRAARRAAVVLATCDATAADIAAHAGIDPARVVVASPGASLSVTAAAPPVRPPYLLAIGAVTPRKGFDVLAEAVTRLGDGAPPLVIAGPDGWQADQVRRRVAALRAPVRFLGRVGDDVLASLLTHTVALCHPSRAEGFGIPVVEAMALGTPVVATDLAPVAETTAGAAALVPVDDVEALASELKAVVDDEERRRRMAVAGRRRAASYTWEVMAGAVVDAYRRAQAG